jgi:flagellar L-ring protein precursor FlgH
MPMKKRAALCMVVGIFLLSGCASLSKKMPDVNGPKKVEQPHLPEYPSPRLEAGSLWSEAQGTALFQDRRACRVGDIVTVRIVEDPEAELNANTKTSRSSSIDAKLEFLGYMKWLAQKNPNLAQNPGVDPLFTSELTSNFDGKGTSNRDGHVAAYVPAMVMKVLPNGYLVISGTREIMVNNETQYITLSGIVRPDDIGSSNEVSSTFMADAKIVYTGTGPVADKQRPGWLGRVIDYVYPF